MTTKSRKKLTRSAREALDYSLMSPDRVRRVIKYVVRVSEDSAQRGLVTALLDALDSLDRRSWTARDRLVTLAKLALYLADREDGE